MIRAGSSDNSDRLGAIAPHRESGGTQLRMREMVVIRCSTVGTSLHVLTVAGGPAPRFEPGQFVHVLALGRGAPLLPRPLSILRWDRDRLDLLLKVVGSGTSHLAALSKGTTVRVLGPLGRGFRPSRVSSALVVGGGVGIAPLVPLVRRLCGSGVSTVCAYGASTAEGLALRREVEVAGAKLALATEDGTLGRCGDVIGLVRHLEPELSHGGRGPWVAACGPWDMMRHLWHVVRGWGSRMEVSLESRMACGVGACLGCAIARADGAGYSYVCTDGPVFDADAVDWSQPPL